MDLMKKRNGKIVGTIFQTEDIVIADFNVMDYDADITGVSDSTEAIQRAIDDCYSSGGGTVWMPAGVYMVSDTIKVKAFVTLRGDWNNPDSANGEYGTVIKAQISSGDNSPVLFRIGGSAGVMGVTTYYTNQNSANPIPYNFTFEIPGRAWVGEENTMMGSIINCTMLNSYRGIGVSTMANENGYDISGGQVHETVTVRNVKGTVLYIGIEAYNGSDVGTWENISFKNSYWANAGEKFNAQDINSLNKWTASNATALKLGDLEWDDFYKVECSNYNIGIHIVPGHRISFCGQFLYAKILNTNTALKAEPGTIDKRWGMSFLRSELCGSATAIDNNALGYVKLTDCKTEGEMKGIVYKYSPGTTPAAYPERTDFTETSVAILYDVTKRPYNAPYVTSTGRVLPDKDATEALQAALDDAGKTGGIVYLPAGWYKIDTHLKVPAHVELRGASAVPARDQSSYSAGTVLFAYEGHDTDEPETDTALINLNGDNSGVSGLRVFYPKNNPMTGLVPYPYTIRGEGFNLKIRNIGLPNSFNGIDLRTHRCDGHLVRKVVGCVFNNCITVGECSSGRIEGVLTNGNAVCRVGYGIPGWIGTDAVSGKDLFKYVIDSYARPYESLIVIDGAQAEHILNCFAYGIRYGLHVISGNVFTFNLGTDNLHEEGFGIRNDGGNVRVFNYMRYNGATSKGHIELYNEMHL